MHRKTQLYIRGVVAAMNRTRISLAAGVALEERTVFLAGIRNVTSEVERICRKQRVSLKRLPAPTYRAYQYLKDVSQRPFPDRQNLSTRSPERVRVSGIMSACTRVHDLAALAVNDSVHSGKAIGPAQVNAIHDRIEAALKSIDHALLRMGASPAELPTRSGNGYAWLLFLQDKVQLKQHLHALGVAGNAYSHESGTQIRRKQDPYQHVHIRFFPLRALYRFKPNRTQSALTINEGFIYADRAVLTCIMQMLFHRKPRPARQEVLEYSQSDAFIRIQRQLERSLISSEQVQGVYYDLQKIFTVVNNNYFDGAMTVPGLAWTPTLTSRVYGMYQLDRDRVVISQSLDDLQVPEHVLEFVMYHELLHRQIGVQAIDGRRVVHSASFKKREQEFRRYAEAREFLQSFSEQF